MTRLPVGLHHTCGAPLRIALVTETWPPEVNGVSTTIARIAQGLHTQGHHLMLVRPRQDKSDQPAHRPRWNEHLVASAALPRYPDLRAGLAWPASLARRWRQDRPDVVHLVTEGPLGWAALRAATRLGLPVVSDFRTNFHAYSHHYGAGWLQRPIEAWLRHFHNRTACTMVPTARLAEALAGSGFERLRVVARGVDAEQFHPARRDAALRERWGAGPDTLVALCVGRLAPEKNLDTVVDAWEAMRAVRPDSRLVLVGDGPDRERLRQRCPQAVFAGTQRGTDLAAHYASADAFVFASTTETFGNVVPEAMASGLPVVSYALAAAGDLIAHGHNGLLAPADDRLAFLAEATRLAHRPDEAAELGRAARVSAQALDWRHIVSGVERAYRDALPARAAPDKAAQDMATQDGAVRANPLRSAG